MRCDKCGRTLMPGGLKYKLDLRLWADFDGYLSPGIERETPESMQNLLEEIAHMDPKMLEEDVYKQMEFTLCKICRDHFAANPLNLPLCCEIPDGLPPREKQ